jgi:thymidylate synthase
MYKLIEPFGYHISANTIGDAWLSLVGAVIKHGVKTLDEGRERLCLQNVRLRVEGPNFRDKLIDRYGDKKKIEDIIFLTFKGLKMYDCDVKQSFSPGPKSYYARLKEGNMINYVVERLAEIPESKKAVISFIHWDDYKAVLDNPKDDYLPCIVSIQFRMLQKPRGYSMNVTFNSRSIDAFQKSCGNLVAITMLTNKIISRLEKRVGKKIFFDSLDGMITDAHIYEECYQEASFLIKKLKYEKTKSL